MEKDMADAIEGLLLAERVLVVLKTMRHSFLLCVGGFDYLQQQPWQAGVATQVDCIFGGAP